jgi:hypothetical protein
MRARTFGMGKQHVPMPAEQSGHPAPAPRARLRRNPFPAIFDI